MDLTPTFSIRYFLGKTRGLISFRDRIPLWQEKKSHPQYKHSLPLKYSTGIFLPVRVWTTKPSAGADGNNFLEKQKGTGANKSIENCEVTSGEMK